MRCQHARDLISLALDVPMPEYERTRLADHMAECADCRRHQEVLEQGRELMRKGTATVSENFEWKVQLGIQRALRQRAAAAEAPAPRGAFWRPMLGSAAAVAAAVVLVGSFVLLPRGDDAADPARDAALGPVAQDTPAQPDLSGAVRGPDLDFDIGDSRFGIRTVGGTVPPQYQSYTRGTESSVPPSAWPQAGLTTVGNGLRAVPGNSGSPMPRLHLVIRGSTLRSVSPAPADTSAHEETSEVSASPR